MSAESTTSPTPAGVKALETSDQHLEELQDSIEAGNYCLEDDAVDVIGQLIDAVRMSIKEAQAKESEIKGDNHTQRIEALEGEVKTLKSHFSKEVEDLKTQHHDALMGITKELKAAKAPLGLSAVADLVNRLDRITTGMTDSTLSQSPTITSETATGESVNEHATHDGANETDGAITVKDIDITAKGLEFSIKVMLGKTGEPKPVDVDSFTNTELPRGWELPQFAGRVEESLDQWEHRIRQDFILCQLRKSLWVPLASSCLDGDAYQWWELNYKELWNASWSEFIEALRARVPHGFQQACLLRAFEAITFDGDYIKYNRSFTALAPAANPAHIPFSLISRLYVEPIPAEDRRFILDKKPTSLNDLVQASYSIVWTNLLSERASKEEQKAKEVAPSGSNTAQGPAHKV